MLRLPVYQRILAELVRAGARTVSSEQLAELARVNAAKVRKDLSLLGSFGTRGSGYDPEFLIAQIDRALGVDENWSVAIVGIGNLGRALTNSAGFASRGSRSPRSSTSTRPWSARRSGASRSATWTRSPPCAPAERPAIGVITTPGLGGPGRGRPAGAGRGDLAAQLRPPGARRPARRCTCATWTCPLSCRSWASTGPARTSSGGPAPTGVERGPLMRRWASRRTRNWTEPPNGPSAVPGRAADWQSGVRDRHNCEPTQEGTECPSSS